MVLFAGRLLVLTANSTLIHFPGAPGHRPAGVGRTRRQSPDLSSCKSGGASRPPPPLRQPPVFSFPKPVPAACPWLWHLPAPLLLALFRFLGIDLGFTCVCLLSPRLNLTFAHCSPELSPGVEPALLHVKPRRTH